MKKAFPLFLFLAMFAVHNSTAQPKNTAPKNQDKAITISVKGVEYDNPAFEDLRKSVKGNMKVKQASPGFTGDVAKISLQYQGNAAELWDELPQTCKQNFKVIAIDENKIELQLKTNTAQATSKTPETKKEDCIDCYYYKNCYFDTSIVFDGNLYRGNKNKGSYYYCKNGVLYSKSVSGKNAFSQIIFKANEPVGTNWIDTFGTTIIKKAIISKGIGIRYNKTYYDDVIIVYYADNSLIANYYYVKASGYIKRDTVEKDFNPVVASKLKGIADTVLVGIWKNFNEVNKTNYYYKFNGDGTFEYYSGFVKKEYQMPQGVSYWRVNSNSLEIYNGAWSDVSRVAFQKKNDPVSGKPAIVFGSGNGSIYFVSDDGKAAWK